MAASRMEQVFYATHSKLSSSILRHTTHRLRSGIEHFVLGCAVAAFCVVLLSHVTFVHRGDFFRGENTCSASSGECAGGVSVYSILITLVRSGYGWVVSSLDEGRISFWSRRKQIPMSCLKSVPGFSEEADVTHILLRMDTEGNGTGSRAFTIHSGRGENELVLTGMPIAMEEGVHLMHQSSSCVIIDDANSEKSTKTNRAQRFRLAKEKSHNTPTRCPVEISSLLSRQGYLQNHATNYTLHPKTIYSYSHAKGLLLLSPSLKQSHNISTQFVLASSTDVNCFGEPFVQNIVFSLVGPDTVILNWVLGLQQHMAGDKKIRFVHHWKTGKELDLDAFDKDHYAFSSSSTSKYGISNHPMLQLFIGKVHKHPVCRLLRFFLFKLTVFLSTLFIFFLTTSLVSFTFQETQDRMLEFTIQLQTNVRARLPLGGLIFRHILENLVFVPVMVGMIFFLIEFYGGDKFLAFTVLSVVWVAEVFSAISIRSIQGMHFFPRVFFLYFTLLHVYFFSCPIGFTYASLVSTVLFLGHTMLFFLNRYELPAMRAGLITPERPRMTRIWEMHAANTQVVSSLHVQTQTGPAIPDLVSRFDDLQTISNTNRTEPLTTSTTAITQQHTMLSQNTGIMRSYVAAASTSLQSIRSLASMQSLTSLADRASSPNWLYGFATNLNGVADSEDDDSYMAYVGDGARSSLSMAIETR